MNRLEIRVSEHFKKIIIALGILGILGIVIVIGFSVFFVCFIKDLKGAKAPLFGENALSKEETFQILIQNHGKFEKVVDAITYGRYLKVYNYDKTLAEKGEPIKELLVEVQIGDNMYREWLVCYEGMIIVFKYNEEMDCVGAEANIQIIGEQYSFGWKKVKVGDERGKIEKIFENSKCIPDSKVHLFDNQGNVVYEKITFYYSDNYECGMGFSYDEQDKVKTIMVVLGGL